MSTRGAYGFYIDGETKVSYNHSESYPSWLGKEVVNQIESLLSIDIEDVKRKVRSIEMVDEDDTPTFDQIERLRKYSDIDVGNGSEQDWYCLLRNTQGDLIADIDAGYMIDSQDFLQSSLFCEWAYIFNLDTMELEIYEGFMKKPHNKGRYAGEVNENGYYPVALIASFSVDDPDLVDKVLALEEKDD